MGAVYEAVDQTTGARVAVKLIHRIVMSGATEDTSARVGRFQREAKAASAIDSEHVARVLDWGTDNDGAPFMVMELLEGEDLQRLFKRVDVLRPDVAVRIGAQACAGLAKAHEAHIVHRDIKPGNLMLARAPSGDLVVKLLDFGIAKVRPEMGPGSETTGLTRTGALLGSPRYMSPEQARGSKTLDYRTDLWSLGVVLFRALTGRLPHESADALGEFIVVLCSEPPPSVQEVAPWVPPEIAAIVDRALQIDRDKRFASADEMHEALLALLPHGDRLRSEMLAPLEPAGRVLTQPRLSVAPPPAEITAPPATTPEGLSTVSGAVHPGAAPARGTASATILALALVAIAAVGVAVMRSSSSPSASGTVTAASIAPAPAPVPDRTVTLVIVPSDASVEVEGAPVKVRDGVIDLLGQPGSVHKVSVSKAGRRAEFRVVIAEAGAMPPKVALPPPPPEAPAPTAAKPVPVAPRAAPKPKPQPKAPAKDPLIPERFE